MGYCDCDEFISDLEQQIMTAQNCWMVLKDKYAEVARALGFEGDAFFGDPLVAHEVIVERAKQSYECLLVDSVAYGSKDD